VNLDKHRRRYKNSLEASSMKSETKRHSGEGKIMYIRALEWGSNEVGIYVLASITLTVNVFTI